MFTNLLAYKVFAFAPGLGVAAAIAAARPAPTAEPDVKAADPDQRSPRVEAWRAPEWWEYRHYERR